MGTYRDWMKRLVPPWLQGHWGGALIEAFGAQLDQHADEMIEARKTGMPVSTSMSAAADSLDKIGAERQLEHAPAESAGSYGERLRRAWDTWTIAGSHRALLEQIRIAGLNGAVIVQRSGRRTYLDGAGNLVVTDGALWTFDWNPPEAYGQFALLFTSAQPTLTWSSSTGFSPMAAKLNRLAWRWRPAKADFMGTHVINSGRVWGYPSTRVWGAGTWGGSVTFIPPK